MDKTQSVVRASGSIELKNGNINDETQIPGLQEVENKLQVLTMTESEKQDYFYHLDSVMQQNDAYETAIEEGREIGIAQGIEQGYMEDKQAMARKMRDAGMDTNLIRQFTGLNPSEY